MLKCDYAVITIKKWISSGKYIPGDKLPSILKLAKMLNMTDQPVRKAIAQLVQEELVVTRNGIGVFVCDPILDRKKIMILSTFGFFSVPDDELYLPGWEIYHGISTAISHENCNSFLYMIVDYKNNPNQVLRKYYDEHCDGIISICSFGDEILDTIVKRIGYGRVVSVSCSNWNKHYNSIRINFSFAIRSILEKAFQLGHRQFAMLYAANISTCWSHMERYRCFMEFCQEHDIEINPHSLVSTDGDAIDAYRKTIKLLNANNKITAIFAVTDLRAKGVIQALKDKGLTPGKDISVIGFDGIPDIEEWDLTTVAIPRKKAGIAAVKLLFQTMGKNKNRETITLDASTVLKGSLDHPVR